MITTTHGNLVELELKALEESGIFTGYASLFDVADLGKDVVRAGAFAKSLQTRPAEKVKMLRQHDMSEPIGVWQSAMEDDRGLLVKGQLILDTTRGRETHALLKAGALDSLSIGYRTIRDSYDRVKGLRYLDEVSLIEISIVTFPALPQAKIAGVKSEGEASQARRIVDAANRIAGRL